jgi:hypothetical protein
MSDSEQNRDTDHDGQEGQVSEVASMDPAAADTPISDDQAVAGYPDSESGRPDEGEAGPNAVPADNIRDVKGETDPGNDYDE